MLKKTALFLKDGFPKKGTYFGKTLVGLSTPGTQQLEAVLVKYITNFQAKVSHAYPSFTFLHLHPPIGIFAKN